VDIVPNLDEASRPLADAWQQTLQATRPEAAALLADLAAHSPPDLAHHFYDVLLEDPRASRFLSHDQVRLRLKPAMQRWLTQLLTATPASVAALVAAQRVIGDVHARVGIPVDLVTRGMRVLKQRLFERIVAQAPNSHVAFDAISCLSASVDIALEGMTLAYTHARERSSRTDAAYRLFSLVQNVSTERERQRALLLDWENALLYAIASQATDADTVDLAHSDFGLWFTHKGIPSFGESSETAQVGALVAQVDAQLHAALAHADVAARFGALQGIREQLARIRTLMGMLFERIGELDAGSTPFSVLLLDLDHFKAINDAHGHDGGDRALQHVAALLGQLTRGSDYLFRYGGEEFVVVLVAATAAQAEVIAENLRRQIAQTPAQLADGTALALTASIGVAAHDGHPDYERLMARADAAMYQAKKRGRNRVVLADDTLPEAPGRQALQRG
jgi:diguanylate cyclase